MAPDRASSVPCNREKAGVPASRFKARTRRLYPRGLIPSPPIRATFADSTRRSSATTPRAWKRGPPCPLEVSSRSSPREAPATDETPESRPDPGVAFLPASDAHRRHPAGCAATLGPSTRPVVSRGTQTEEVITPPSPPVRTPTKPLTPGRSKQHSPTKPLTPGRPKGPSVRTFRTPSHQPTTPSRRLRPSGSPGRFADLLRRIAQASPDRTRLRSVISIPLRPIPRFRRRPFVQDRTKAFFSALERENLLPHRR
ncbi:PREDICTED: leucine-rich repeat extensin-like protein 5 [Wasmannia auropunctata]|uniref:leucine-rich repeat extensin-like protein 5 n=1 Tax=Wasmannia auropunctata TaxID=64793 RepID=UPI0005ED5588|nr:PREDICTED: leucine-rich repeat extensin-like protein 5 [Wasmannia auropunctata]